MHSARSAVAGAWAAGEETPVTDCSSCADLLKERAVLQAERDAWERTATNAQNDYNECRRVAGQMASDLQSQAGLIRQIEALEQQLVEAAERRLRDIQFLEIEIRTRDSIIAELRRALLPH